MEQKRPADIIQELLDYLWNGLGLEEKGWKRLKKGDFKKKMKNGLTYQIWFDRSRYNYIDYEIGHGNVEVGFSCIIKQGDDYLYSFRIEPTTGGSFFRMLTEDLRLNTGLLDTFLPLVKANYLDFIDRFEADPVEALQPVCAPFTEAEDYSWFIYVREQMVERYGTAEQMEEYRRQAELRGTPGHKAKNWMGSMFVAEDGSAPVLHLLGAVGGGEGDGRAAEHGQVVLIIPHAVQILRPDVQHVRHLGHKVPLGAALGGDLQIVVVGEDGLIPVPPPLQQPLLHRAEHVPLLLQNGLGPGGGHLVKGEDGVAPAHLLHVGLGDIVGIPGVDVLSVIDLCTHRGEPVQNGGKVRRGGGGQQHLPPGLFRPQGVFGPVPSVL